MELLSNIVKHALSIAINMPDHKESLKKQELSELMKILKFKEDIVA